MSIDWIALAGVLLTAAGLVWQHLWTRSELHRARELDLREKLVHIPLREFLKLLLEFEYETRRVEGNVAGFDRERLSRRGKHLLRQGSIALKSAQDHNNSNIGPLQLELFEELILRFDREDMPLEEVREHVRWLYAAINSVLVESMRELS